MPVTLKQIAEEVGVSQPLVTYALRNKPGVNKETRQKILDAAQRLGYQGANPEAQRLIARRYGRHHATGIIALLYDRRQEAALMSTPFYRALMEGVEYETGQRELELLITPMRDEKLPRLAQEGRVDGLIFASIPVRAVDEARELNLPAVTLSTHAPPFYSLLPDDEGGTYQATKYLIDNGHHRIAYIGMAQPSWQLPYHVQSEARAMGYKRALAEHGIPFDANYFFQGFNCVETHGMKGLEHLLSQTKWRHGQRPEFTAVVCHNDVMAMGAVRKAQELGLSVPGDLSVVGFDDISTLYNFQPALTSVSFSRFDMGRRAVEWVCSEFNRMTDTPKSEWRISIGTETFATQLMVRDSTCPVVTM